MSTPGNTRSPGVNDRAKTLCRSWKKPSSQTAGRRFGLDAAPQKNAKPSSLPVPVFVGDRAPTHGAAGRSWPAALQHFEHPRGIGAAREPRAPVECRAPRAKPERSERAANNAFPVPRLALRRCSTEWKPQRVASDSTTRTVPPAATRQPAGTWPPRDPWRIAKRRGL